MPKLFAQPYNISATGFYFDCTNDFNEKAKLNVDPFGSPVEEYEIQFIDGDDLDCELFNAWSVHQGNLSGYFNAVNDLEKHEKIAQIAMSECGYTIDENTKTDDVLIYYCDSLADLAMEFVEEGLYGTVPERLRHYIDYDAIARDLGMEYSELNLNDQTIIFCCPQYIRLPQAELKNCFAYGVTSRFIILN